MAGRPTPDELFVAALHHRAPRKEKSRYANTLKAYAQSDGTTVEPTDCGVPRALPEVAHPAVFVLAGGVILAGGFLLYGRRRRPAAV